MTRQQRIFVSGAIALGLAGAAAVFGLVMAGNADFARTYVRDQLRQQDIQFSALDKLSEDEKGSACLVAYAGQVITTGKQAECYANDFIARHLKTVAGGRTYADMGVEFLSLTNQVDKARASSDPALGDLQKQLATVTGLRGTLFQGETSRGLLLTAYGFSNLGVKAGQAAQVAYTTAGLLALASFALLVVALRMSTQARVRSEHTSERPVDEALVLTAT